MQSTEARAGWRGGGVVAEFDIFICHASQHDDWADALAQNLRDIGYRPFNDADVRRIGDRFPEKLQQAIRTVDAAIVVMGVDSYASGWVAEEYSQILKRKVENPAFILIPILVADVPDQADYPGVWARDHIDARPPRDFRQTYAEIVATLRGEPTPRAPWLDALATPHSAQAAAAATTEAAAADVFREAARSPITLLLSQAHALDGGFFAAAVEQAERRFGPDAVLALTAPSRRGITKESFISRLAGPLANGAPIETFDALHDAIQDRIAAKGRLALIMRGLERCHESWRERIAADLRDLTEEAPPGAFAVILQGGERLCDLKYAAGRLSVLTNATDVRWRELTQDDLIAMAAADGLPADSVAAAAEAILAESGGHPLLTRQCLDLLHDNQDTDAADFRDHLRAQDVAGTEFAALVGDLDLRADLADAAERDPVGTFNWHLNAPLLRWLYWRNLVRRAGDNALVWRCPAIHEAALRSAAA